MSGNVPHPFIVTLAISEVRGIALWASDGTLIFGMPGAVQKVGSDRISWFPISISSSSGWPCSS